MYKITEIEEYLETLRPALQMDGGDIFIKNYDAEAGLLELGLLGACASCVIQDVTLNQFIRKTLLDKFPDIKKIVTD